MTAKFVIPSTVVIVFCGVLSCAAGTQQEPRSGGVEPAAETSVGLEAIPRTHDKSNESAAAVTDVCEDRPCVSNSDCCKGASCGFDPERSHAQRYCMGG